jgi:hypothetical protein
LTQPKKHSTKERSTVLPTTTTTTTNFPNPTQLTSGPQKVLTMVVFMQRPIIQIQVVLQAYDATVVMLAT